MKPAPSISYPERSNPAVVELLYSSINEASAGTGLYMISLITTQSFGEVSAPVYVIVIVSIAPPTSFPCASNPRKFKTFEAAVNGTAIVHVVTEVHVTG